MPLTPVIGSAWLQAIQNDFGTQLISSLDIISFSGHNGAGACTMTGVKAGDVVVSLTGLASGTVGDKSSSFESVITVNDQIQQSAATDLSANVYMVLILRMS